MPWGIAGALETVLMTISIIALRVAQALPALKRAVLDCSDNRRDYDDMIDGFALSLRAMLLDGWLMPSLRAMNAEDFPRRSVFSEHPRAVQVPALKPRMVPALFYR